jgi:thymidylate synthase (FAD)
MIEALYGDGLGELSLIDYMGSDKRAVDAARVSFLDDDIQEVELNEKDTRLLAFLIRERHTSPFEHTAITFRIKVPLYVRAQVMRHRTFSFNEVSRRYTSESIDFHIPHTLRQQAKTNLQCSTDDSVDNADKLLEVYKRSTARAFQEYQVLLDCGVAREQARALLPQNMYTVFYMTGSLHNYIHFLRLRLDSHAQHETRELAEAMQDILYNIFPVTMEAVDL